MTKHQEISCKDAIAYLKVQVKEAFNEIELNSDEEPVMISIGNDLLISFLVDAGEEYRYIQGSHLVNEGMTKEDLKEIGIANLKRIAQERLEIKGLNGIYAAFMNGDFEASIILLDDIWDIELKKYADNDFVVAIPARDILAICDSKNEKGIEYLKSVCERVSESGDHLLTNDLYIRKDKTWEKLNQ